ncbi:LacI family DNA-binding transcriptional regulator [Rhodobacter sp. KR11]|uniref:LacI family DNA-binding transcriptional regulator n=1 Tax=Rhodobacter sp. KR11 TaxID=2974588 RepID=UPI0022230128|nr:LacI family DNA-binding transcriptional regulator [Rhodobacter sp. KR11]MCW1920275.1 LacI family DNA-binding transcriptional regulator [Rhodobacter sp. KR11]
MTKKPTMNDIAMAAAVSQATVSLVLNEVANARIAPETRARVLEAATALGYARRAGRSEGQRLIGLMIDDVSYTPFAAPFLEGARAEAQAAGALVMVVVTENDPGQEEAALRQFAAMGAEGVILASLLTREITPPPGLSRLPAILLNGHDAGGVFASVVPGDVLGGFAATEALIKAGHRRIAHIPGESWGEASNDRFEGYRRALASHDIPYDPALVSEPAWTMSIARARMAGLLAARPTAVFCFSDRVAFGAYGAIEAAGLRVGRDISVVGFDNDDLAQHMAPPLTTVILPHEDMARWAVARLLERTGPLPATRMKIDCTLVERASVGAPP